MSTTFVKYNDPKLEPEVANEDGLKKEIQELITKFQHNNFSAHRHGFRGTHVKTQAVVKGTFTVKSDLPDHLAVGICSKDNASRAHPLAIRFANEPSFMQDDRIPGPRGCGVRVFDVSGDFMDPIGEQTKTQDFTFNNAPILELRDLPTTVEIFKIRERNFRTPDKIADEVQKRDDAEVQMAPTQLPNQHFVSYVMYSQSAFRWGDAVVKYALFPSTKLQQELEKQKIDDFSDPEQHSIWLREFFRNNDAEYDFKVQLCKDIDAQNVEDTSVQWDEEKYPFETVGKVSIPKGQDSFSSERRVYWEEHVKLNVWYGLEVHRPLGSVNRLRKELYKVSARNRAELNASTIRDINSVDFIP